MNSQEAGSLGNIERTLGSLDATMKAIAERMDRHYAHHIHIEARGEARLSKLENRQHWYSGAAAAVGAIASVIGFKLKGLI